MFYGEYEHTIDKKGRLIIPSKFREAFKEYDVEKFFITRGLDKCLFMFTENEWKTQESKFKAISFTKSESRRFNRMYFAGASQIECDKQGRILIPKYLKDYAAIKRDVIWESVAASWQLKRGRTDGRECLLTWVFHAKPVFSCAQGE